MTKVIKKNIDAFKNLKLKGEKAGKIKGGADSDPIIFEDLLDS